MAVPADRSAVSRADDLVSRFEGRVRRLPTTCAASVAALRRTGAAPSSDAAPAALVRLPFLGATTVEDVAFYAVLTGVAITEVVAWPTAALVGGGHVLHQRARAIAGTQRSAIIEGVLEATDEAW
jgi:hypothetical protein